MASFHQSNTSSSLGRKEREPNRTKSCGKHPEKRNESKNKNKEEFISKGRPSNLFSRHLPNHRKERTEEHIEAGEEIKRTYTDAELEQTFDRPAREGALREESNSEEKHGKTQTQSQITYCSKKRTSYRETTCLGNQCCRNDW